MRFTESSETTRYSGAWLLVATLSLLVFVAIAAAVGSAAWIARSGDEAREIEDRGMLIMAMSEQRAQFSDHARRAAAAIAALGPNAAGPVADRISAVLAPGALGSTRYGEALLLRDEAVVVASFPPDSRPRGVAVDPDITRMIGLVEGAGGREAAGMAMDHAHMAQDSRDVRTLGHHVGIGGVDGMTSFIRLHGRLYEMAIATVGDGTTAPGSGALTGMTVVLLGEIDRTLISHMSAQHRVADLRTATEPPPPPLASLTFYDAAGEAAGYLVWTPATPVSSAFGEAMPFFAALALALVALAGLAGVQSIVSNRKLAAQERLARFEADHDALTKLLNRTAFVEAVRRRLGEAGDAPVSILYLDLDGFKEINDTLGHQTGDELLICVAERIRGAVGDQASLARLGGDEFAVMLDRAGTEAAAEVGGEIMAAIRRPIPIGGKSLTMNASIGLACAPQHGGDPRELMRRADIALYAAKKRGRGQVALFDDSMEEQIRHRQLVELDLRAALGTDQISLAFQPIMASDGARPLGVEALLRWNHPQRGPIPPSDFIPVAEETGFIRVLGVWVLQEACRTVKQWPGLTVAVNMSPVQMRSRDIVTVVAGVLSDTGLEPNRLVLEVTEGILIEHQDEATSIIRALQRLGVRVALDDFGTGYSSLAYLKRFPFDKLKIDKSFIDSLGQRADDATIVHAIISLGRALGMSVVAEGVETTEQHRFLRAAGCHELQGYLFCRPAPAGEIDRLLHRPGQGLEAVRSPHEGRLGIAHVA